MVCKCTAIKLVGDLIPRYDKAIVDPKKNQSWLKCEKTGSHRTFKDCQRPAKDSKRQGSLKDQLWYTFKGLPMQIIKC